MNGTDQADKMKTSNTSAGAAAVLSASPLEQAVVPLVLGLTTERLGPEVRAAVSTLLALDPHPPAAELAALCAA
jgi:hypothetical protein